MIAIPAIDIKDGRCVRLVHGDPKKETVYSDDPVEMAARWADLGAERLHVVDLNGAFGEESNLDVVLKVRERIKIPIELGGGLRSLAAVRHVLSRGIDWAIVGTALLKEPEWVAQAALEFPGRIIAGLDTKGGEVMVEGWQEGSGVQLKNILLKIEAMKISDIIYTDIARDGTLEGPNVPSVQYVLNNTRLGVYASGGVSNLEDVKTLKTLEAQGLKGFITGKALYDGRLDFAEAVKASR